MAAVFAPVLVGVKVTLTEQFAPAASDPPQVFADMANMAALVPVKVMLANTSVSPPVLVTVVDRGELVTVTAVFGKVIVVGLKLINGNPTPVPLTGTLCGLPAALSVNTIADDRDPEADGLNTTLTVQVPPEGATLAHPVGVGTKSPELAPDDTIEVMVRAALPEFVTVRVCGADVVPTV
jgi:hypothetical protein